MKIAFLYLHLIFCCALKAQLIQLTNTDNKYFSQINFTYHDFQDEKYILIQNSENEFFVKKLLYNGEYIRINVIDVEQCSHKFDSKLKYFPLLIFKDKIFFKSEGSILIHDLFTQNYKEELYDEELDYSNIIGKYLVFQNYFDNNILVYDYVNNTFPVKKDINYRSTVIFMNDHYIYSYNEIDQSLEKLSRTNNEIIYLKSLQSGFSHYTSFNALYILNGNEIIKIDQNDTISYKIVTNVDQILKSKFHPVNSQTKIYFDLSTIDKKYLYELNSPTLELKYFELENIKSIDDFTLISSDTSNLIFSCKEKDYHANYFLKYNLEDTTFIKTNRQIDFKEIYTPSKKYLYYQDIQKPNYLHFIKVSDFTHDSILIENNSYMQGIQHHDSISVLIYRTVYNEIHSVYLIDDSIVKYDDFDTESKGISQYHSELYSKIKSENYIFIESNESIKLFDIKNEKLLILYPWDFGEYKKFKIYNIYKDKLYIILSRNNYYFNLIEYDLLGHVFTFIVKDYILINPKFDIIGNVVKLDYKTEFDLTSKVVYELENNSRFYSLNYENDFNYYFYKEGNIYKKPKNSNENYMFVASSNEVEFFSNFELLNRGDDFIIRLNNDSLSFKTVGKLNITVFNYNDKNKSIIILAKEINNGYKNKLIYANFSNKVIEETNITFDDKYSVGNMTIPNENFFFTYFEKETNDKYLLRYNLTTKLTSVKLISSNDRILTSYRNDVYLVNYNHNTIDKYDSNFNLLKIIDSKSYTTKFIYQTKFNNLNGLNEEIFLDKSFLTFEQELLLLDKIYDTLITISDCNTLLYSSNIYTQEISNDIADSSIYFLGFNVNHQTGVQLYKYLFGSEISSSIYNPSYSDILIYPNPVNSTLSFIGENCENCEYQIYDVLGKLVDSGKILINEIDVSPLIKGLYYFSIKDKRSSIFYKY